MDATLAQKDPDRTLCGANCNCNRALFVGRPYVFQIVPRKKPAPAANTTFVGGVLHVDSHFHARRASQPLFNKPINGAFGLFGHLARMNCRLSAKSI